MNDATHDRYGTALRCYDNGGKTADRYTILPPRYAKQYRENAPGMWQAIGANAAPFHPQGIGMHVTATPGSHLGRRVHWDDLPEDVQRFARQSFPEYAPALGTVEYHRGPTESEIRLGYGATHYRDFAIETARVRGKATTWGAPILKRWLIAPDDGLRYYR